ncbi:hypothetical protein D1872_312290 [compost metagenome]
MGKEHIADDLFAGYIYRHFERNPTQIFHPELLPLKRKPYQCRTQRRDRVPEMAGDFIGDAARTDFGKTHPSGRDNDTVRLKYSF